MSGRPVYLSAPGVICAAGSSVQALRISAVSGSQKGIQLLPADHDGGEAASGTHYAGLVEEPLARHAKELSAPRSLLLAQKAVQQLGEAAAAARDRYGADRIAVCACSDIRCDTAAQLSGRFKLTGPVWECFAPLDSASGAIIQAAEFIRAGKADAAIAGGAGSIPGCSGEAVRGLINPFSRNRCGTTYGEGAAFFLLTAEAAAGMKTDSDVPVQLRAWSSVRTDGDGADTAGMRQAVDAAHADAVGYVNLHGSGIPDCDAMEAAAAAAVFGTDVPMSGTKPLTGYVPGAAGALELSFCYAALTAPDGALPVHVWDYCADAGLPRLNLHAVGMYERSMNDRTSRGLCVYACHTICAGSAQTLVISR